MKKQLLFLSMAFGAILLLGTYSCKKNSSLNQPVSGQFDNSLKVNTTIIGSVLAEDGSPLSNVTVNVSGNTFTTDSKGLFYFNNISTSKSASVVSASKSGYFNGYKTIMVEAGKQEYVQLVLMSKGTPQIVNGITGGKVNFTNASVIFSANSFVFKNNGSAFTGNVSVYTRWLDPTSKDLSLTIPGSLRGVNTNNQEQALSSYGMIAVELYDDAGNELQLASNKPAEIHMTIPASIKAAAPASIPLWYFDPANGMWTEEGKATMVGSEYIGSVKHFTYWNCDFPNSILTVTFNLVDPLGNPIANTYVNFTTAGSFNHCGGYTDAAGYATCTLPANMTFTMTVSNSMTSCPLPIYSQTVTTFTSNLTLGAIVVPVSSALQFIPVTGNVVDCGGNPVTNGFVSIDMGTGAYIFSTNSTGVFSGNVVTCSLPPMTASMIGYDMSANVSGAATTVNLTAGPNNLGTAIACGNTFQYVYYTSTYGGATHNYSIVEPSGTFTQNFVLSNTGIDAHQGNSYTGFTFDGLQSTSGAHNLTNYYDQDDSLYTIPTPIPVNITNYGPVGSYIDGNFNGIVTGLVIGNATITSNFRIKRSF